MSVYMFEFYDYYHFTLFFARGFNFSTLGTTLLQIPYGMFISLMILAAVFLNDRLPKNNFRTIVMILFILPNIAGTLGLLLTPNHRHIPRLICYYLTGSYNVCFI